MLQQRCPEILQNSRLETDCVEGDGVIFRFPSPDCSPFDGSAVGMFFINEAVFVYIVGVLCLTRRA